MDSRELFERSRKVAPGGVHSPVRAFLSVGGTPVFFQSASGAYLHSVEGDEYVDFCQSFGPNILGHRDPDVQKVVEETVRQAWSFGACEPYSLALAENIVTRLPWVEKIRFVSSGTEAVMSALRVARAATGRSKILKFEGCYHGHADGLLVKAGSGLAGAAASDSAGVSDVIAAQTLVAPLDDEAALEKVFQEHGTDIAAVILEPLPANFGLLIQRPEFIRRVVETARAHQSLVVFDEVISGFRVQMGGMAEILDLRPDLVTYGKILGGGFPVGAYGGRADLMDMVAPQGKVYQAGTLSAHPVGMRAGLATLEKLESQNIHRALNDRTTEFVEDLNRELSETPLRAISQGSLFWIHPHSEHPPRSLKDLPPDLGETYKSFFHACLRRKIYLAPSGYEVGFVSWAHTPELLKQCTTEIGAAAREAFSL